MLTFIFTECTWSSFGLVLCLGLGLFWLLKGARLISGASWLIKNHPDAWEGTSLDLSSSIAIVTGANSGIGYYIALGLARRGSNVILACRNKIRGEAAAREINIILSKFSCKGHAEFWLLDLSSMQSVRSFASRFVQEKGMHLNILVNNAAISDRTSSLTAEGLNVTYATNHLGPFLLTNLLLDPLKASAPSRVVTVTSIVYRWASEPLAILRRTKDILPKHFSYGISKLMNVLFTMELARRLHHSGVTSNCVHPGYVRTGILRNTPAIIRMAIHTLGFPFTLSAKHGAKAPLFLCLSRSLTFASGLYFEPDLRSSLPTLTALDPHLSKELWRESEKLTGLQNGECLGEARSKEEEITELEGKEGSCRERERVRVKVTSDP
uniref:retinol dehydrogenase 12-like isoform X1 n=1 Tax=Myxine glutinosa TaxID=7769 RepID=UPI00358ECDAB